MDQDNDRVTRGELQAIAKLTLQNRKDLETLLANQERLYAALRRLSELIVHIHGLPLVTKLKLGQA